ncbi:MAG TPA: non-homologous end-joining DNA ligase [Candidatus Thermoplasmatota archaeon]
MLATASSELPRAEGFGYEFKWDGYRAIIHLRKGDVRIDSRRTNDVTRRFPQIAAGARRVHEPHLILDGEIVALDQENRPSFGLLQQHLRVPGAGPVPRTPPPVVFFAFDLLQRGAKSYLSRPYVERREILSDIAFDDAGWKVPPYEVDQGPAMIRVSDQVRLEGIVAKRLDSVYVPGTRSRDWLKIKHRRRQEFVVGGWTRGEGGRSGTFGALVLGYYDRRASETGPRDAKPRLVYAGRVGTGFDDATLRRLLEQLKGIERASNPFGEGDPGNEVTFVEPRLVAEVSFTEWTHLGQLRQTSFHGLRTDKEPAEVVKEPMFEGTKEET